MPCSGELETSSYVVVPVKDKTTEQEIATNESSNYSKR
jgi:hypothetical protein